MMILHKVKILISISILLLLVGFITVGCKQKPQKSALVNTNLMPGHSFSQNNNSTINRSNFKVVYLGANKKSYSYNGFGPKDVSFDFKVLK